eukprot:gene4752-6784_t
MRLMKGVPPMEELAAAGLVPILFGFVSDDDELAASALSRIAPAALHSHAGDLRTVAGALREEKARLKAYDRGLK